MDQSKPQHPPGSSRRLTSGIGGMWNKSMNTVRNKAFSRASRHVSSEMSDGVRHTRQSGSIKSIGQSSTKMGKENDKMVRSKTTSFLPVPTKSSTRPPPPPIPAKAPNNHAKAGSETRIPSTAPRVSFSRPSYLPRSTTHPNLPTMTSGRRASEYSRRNSARWPLEVEETTPLLRSPLLESPMLKTPTSDDDWFTSNPLVDSVGKENTTGRMQKVSTPTWLNRPLHSSGTGKVNMSSPSMCLKSSSPIRSPRDIQHHQLQRPLPPKTPPSNGMFRNVTDATVAYLTTPVFSPPRPVFANRQNVQRPSPLHACPAPERNIYTIDRAQANAYWSGRFISLSDKLWNEAFVVDSRPTNEDDVDTSNESAVNVSRPGTSTKGSSCFDFRIAKRVFQTLESACTTDEARRSLILFRNMYAINTKMEELKCELPPVTWKEPRDLALSSSIGSGNGLVGAGSRKMSFMGMLRGRKSSGKSILSLRD